MDCKLQVFKHEARLRRQGFVYRFAVLDSYKSKFYPANFVCMLPVKIPTGNAKQSSAFGRLFGNGSFDKAIGLLNDALKTETEIEVKAELEKRLKLLDPRQANLIKCGSCKSMFRPLKLRRYKRYLCDKCLKERYR